MMGVARPLPAWLLRDCERADVTLTPIRVLGGRALLFEESGGLFEVVERAPGILRVLAWGYESDRADVFYGDLHYD